MKKFQANKFSYSSRQQWNDTFPWGGGHTTTSDPTKRDWRLKAVSKQLAVISRTGVEGCLSVMIIDNGLDVAFYDEMTLEEVYRRLRSGERLIADEFRQI